jgi:aminoglycoside phosphotransferase (APT) family kinase protein
MTRPLVDTSPRLRPSGDSVAQHWPALAAHLSALGMKLELDPLPQQFSGGLANLNYLVAIDGRQYVLRRPPMGKLPPGAYDMGREFRILGSLSRGFDLAPGTLHHCDDAAILGAPFQLIEYRAGFSVRDSLPGALAGQPEVCRKLSAVLLDAMVRLHRLDPAGVGLGELGRPEGFVERTVEGWIKRARLATEGCMSPLIPELGEWLRRHRIADAPPSLIHNDLKLDNILLDGATLEAVAVLDWDQCTRGDPLFDLATTLSYWSEAGDPPAMQRLAQMPTAAPGFPSRREFALAYAQATGRDLSQFQFLRVLAIYKLATIFHQLHLRYRTGATTDPRYAAFGELADGILEFAHAVAQGALF